MQGVTLPGNCFPPSEICWLPAQWTVTFQLANRKSRAVGQALPSIEAASGVDGDQNGWSRRLIGGSPLNRASREAVVSAASVTYDGMIQGVRNNLTMSFSFSTMLPGQADARFSSFVTISGLVGTMTSDDDALPLYGEDAALFAGRSALWRQAEGTLTLTVAAGTSVLPDYNVQISMLFLNPMAAQAGVTPTISATVRYPPPPPARFHPDFGTIAFVGIAPLEIADRAVDGVDILSASTQRMFTMKIVHESTQVLTCWLVPLPVLEGARIGRTHARTHARPHIHNECTMVPHLS